MRECRTIPCAVVPVKEFKGIKEVGWKLQVRNSYSIKHRRNGNVYRMLEMWNFVRGGIRFPIRTIVALATSTLVSMYFLGTVPFNLRRDQGRWKNWTAT